MEATILTPQSEAQKTFRIVESNQTFVQTTVPGGWETLTPAEARGYIWMFEPPNHKASYVVGCDPAMGITGWDRTIPGDDQDNDNSAVQVFRIGKREERVWDEALQKHKIITTPVDYQVAEYAGPVDYEATAAVINALGHIYRGTGRMGVAHSIIEVYPGPGWMVEKTLIQKYGYLNFYQPKYINTLEPQTAKGIGWQASQKSRRDLWVMGVRHVRNRQVVIRSPWLLNEMETLRSDEFMMDQTSEARPGFHDDRLRAAMLCWWAAHDFSSQVRVETKTTIENNAKPTSWQSSDMSVDSLKEAMEKRWREIGES